jgi:hypothetical protein
MLTGEVSPDAGDAHICGESVRLRLAAARQHLGYCPQFDGLPHSMTGREVLVMYARWGPRPALPRLPAMPCHARLAPWLPSAYHAYPARLSMCGASLEDTSVDGASCVLLH